MDLSIAAFNTFVNLFKGNPYAHGVHLYTTPDTKPGDKNEGKSWSVEESVTEDMYIRHLHGSTGLGIIPVDRTGNCVFSVIDVDVYKDGHKTILQEVYEYGMPVHPFKSKSGGLHLYIFYETKVEASYAVSLMNTFRSMLGLSNKTEIFPKQTQLAEGAKGSWINLPYYNCEDSKQCLLDSDGNLLDFETGMEICNKRKVNKKTIEAFLSSLPIFDGPPCLQHLYMVKDTQYRSNYLFDLAVYFKAKQGDDFIPSIEEANSQLKDPLPAEELVRTVIASHKKKTYTYKCKEDPIVSICNRALCKKRQFGISSAAISDLSFGEFIQYRSEEPYYEWTINDKRLRFFSEDDILMQDRFRKLVFRELHLMPSKLSDDAWTTILNEASSNIIIKEIATEDDISIGSLFMEYLAEFLTKRAPATKKAQLAVDRVYFDQTRELFLFQFKHLIPFLANKQFKAYGVVEIQAKLKELKAAPMIEDLGINNISIRVWGIPKASIAGFIQASIKDLHTDFMEELPDEPY